MPRKKILVMIPTYNERDNIEGMIKEILKLKNTGIVIVDYNSTDGTREVFESLSKKYRNSLFIMGRTKGGMGTAEIEGLKKCIEKSPEYIIEMDADFSHDPRYIPLFLREIKDCDIVIGSRFVSNGEDSERGVLRRLITISGLVFCRILLMTKNKDITSGFKCYMYNVLASLNLDDFLSKGYSFTIEMDYRLFKNGYNIKEVPIVFADRTMGKSKFRFKDLLESFILVLRLRLVA